MNSWWTADEQLMNWWWTDDEQMMNSWWTADEQLMNCWWTADELLMNWWWTNDELIWSAKDYHRLSQTTTDYHRLPQTTTDYHWLPLTDWLYSIEHSNLSPGCSILLHISLIPPTTRAPLAVLINHHDLTIIIVSVIMIIINVNHHDENYARSAPHHSYIHVVRSSLV